MTEAYQMRDSFSITEAELNLNFKAKFTNAIEPFFVHVDEGFLAVTKQKVSLTRFVEDIDQPDHTDGPPKRFVQQIAYHWAQKYDWRAVENSVNKTFKQYTTTVWIDQDDYREPVPLHFVHHKSSRSDAIPLIFIHGWPGSFLEVEHVIESLTNPPGDKIPAFHVVAPSIPGFGFSPSPRRPGMGYRRVAAAFHALMQKLDYLKYVYQGGDAGDFIGHFMALDFPDAVVSGHSNFWIVPPTDKDLERFASGKSTEDEKYLIEHLGDFAENHWSYGQIHQSRPLKLAIGLTDSPIGLAMWIYDICRTVMQDEEILSPERLITWTMMHWINGPYAAFSIYKHGKTDGVISSQGIQLMPYIEQPIALSQFPYDIWYRTPLDWARRSGNVKCITKHEKGGHFAALDAPDLLVDDVRKFFGDTALSNTQIFLHREQHK